MIAMPHGRAAVLEFTIGGTRDGTVEAYRLRILQDIGAYPRIGAILPGFTSLMASGVYAIPKIEAEFTSVVTNTTPDRAIPRRRPARGDAGDRAGDGSRSQLRSGSIPPRCAVATCSPPTHFR